jgi:predicted transcriptional regulator
MRFGDSEVSFGTSGVRISQLQKKTHKGVPAIFGLTIHVSANPDVGDNSWSLLT